MLVKKSIVEKWYQRDSWVYKNFAYLFQNPLWTKNIPSGFSVCPYFWLNLFSFFIFRPFFVAPIKYLIIPTIKLLGEPARNLDRWLYNKWEKINICPPHYNTGAGFMISILSTIVTAGASTILYLVSSILYNFYNSLDGVYTACYWFWTVTSLVPLFISIIIHKITRTTGCKPGYYFVGWFALFILSLFIFIPHQTLHAISVAFFAIINNVSDFISTCWSGVIYGIKTSFLVLWSTFKAIFLWKPANILIIPWWGIVLVITMIGWIGEKVITKLDNYTIRSLRQKDPAKLYARFRRAWIDLFVRVICSNKRWKSGEIINEDFDIYTARAINFMKYDLLRRTFEEMWKTELDNLQNNYPSVRESGWKAIINSNGTDEKFKCLKSFLENLTIVDTFPDMKVETFIATLKTIVQNDEKIKQLVNQYKLDTICNEKQDSSWAHTTCIKITHTLADITKAIAYGIFHFICWIGSNLNTFRAYVWMLIKAKKQGACPYFRFTDPTPKQ